MNAAAQFESNRRHQPLQQLAATLVCPSSLVVAPGLRLVAELFPSFDDGNTGSHDVGFAGQIRPFAGRGSSRPTSDAASSKIPRRHLPNRFIQQLRQPESGESHLPIDNLDFLSVVLLVQVRSVLHLRCLRQPQ
jgi:hypothetical protein